MPCMPGAYMGAIGAMAFLGAAICCFIVPALGDKYGRYRAWYASICCHLPIYMAGIFTNHIGVVYVCCFWLGFGLVGRFACGYILFTESVPPQHASKFIALYMLGDAAATLYSSFFLRYISNNGIDLMWLGFVLNLIAVIVGWFIVESPAWLVSVGLKEEAIKRLKYIAKFNRKADFELNDISVEKFEVMDKPEGNNANGSRTSSGNADIEEDEANALKNKSGSDLDLKTNEDGEEEEISFTKTKGMLCNLILMTIFWTSSSMNYYIMSFFLKYIPGNIFVNASLACISELMA